VREGRAGTTGKAWMGSRGGEEGEGVVSVLKIKFEILKFFSLARLLLLLLLLLGRGVVVVGPGGCCCWAGGLLLGVVHLGTGLLGLLGLLFNYFKPVVQLRASTCCQGRSLGVSSSCLSWPLLFKFNLFNLYKLLLIAAQLAVVTVT